jgi:hypothetical protein
MSVRVRATSYGAARPNGDAGVNLCWEVDGDQPSPIGPWACRPRGRPAAPNAGRFSAGQRRHRLARRRYLATPVNAARVVGYAAFAVRDDLPRARHV